MLLELSMALTPAPTLNQLKRAVQIQQKIATLQIELLAIFKGGSGKTRGRKSKQTLAFKAEASGIEPSEPKAGTRKKRTMSPEAREKIADAQRRRWAKQKNN